MANKTKSKKTHAVVIAWDEIGGDAIASGVDAKGNEVMLTRDDDEKLVRELRKFNGDEKDDFGEWGWELIGITHLPKTSTVEWRSDRGHHGVTVVCWSLCKDL